MPNKAQDFWNFSLDLYDREGVASACLELQSVYQFDVNLLLFCYWHGSVHGAIDEQLLADAFAFSAQWRQHVVQPLRSTRSWMKQHTDSSEDFELLRESIKADELSAERYQQESIALLVRRWEGNDQGPAGRDACERNIDGLLQSMRLKRDAKIDAALAILTSALGL